MFYVKTPTLFETNFIKLNLSMKTIYYVFVLGLSVLFFSCKKNSIVKDTDSNNQQLKEGLIAYYPFNGNAIDESGNGNNLNVIGATLSENRFGDPEKAYKFNGTSDYMVIPGILGADSLREFSISLWVKVGWPGHNSILSILGTKYCSCSSYLGFDNVNDNFSTWHQMLSTATAYNGSETIIKGKIGNPLNTWNHIVFVQLYDPAVMGGRYTYISYYNGKKIDTVLTAFDTNTIATSFSKGGVIGANNNSGNYSLNFDFFNGYIDDVRIYNRPLSDNEVDQLYLLKE